MHRIRSVVLLLVLLLVGLPSVGCAGSRARDLQVAVREVGTLRPLADATVRVSGADFVNPTDGAAVRPGLAAGGELVTGGDARFRSGFRAAEGRTDAFGLVVLPAPTGAPFEIMVVRSGEPIRRLLLAGTEHPATTRRASEWIALDGPQARIEGAATAVEIQVRPAPW